MRFTLGFSPCPNDTFIFDALVNNKIDTKGLSFDYLLEDVQTLNQWATTEKLDITKISYGVLPFISGKYVLLDSGSALGTGVGPLLIKHPLLPDQPVEQQEIAIPGENTTAHMLLSFAFPKATKKHFLKYDAIENFVQEKRGLGVIIHENRFTYAQKGLDKVMDLGKFWEAQTKHYIPLGGIVIKKNIDMRIALLINSLIRESIEHAYANMDVLSDFIRCNAQEMEEEVMRKHIELYVNRFSIDLGKKGKEAVIKMMQVYREINPHTTIFDPERVFLK